MGLPAAGGTGRGEMHVGPRISESVRGEPSAACGSSRPEMLRLAAGGARMEIAMSTGSDYLLRRIGWVRSPLVDLADAPKQGDEGAPAAELVFAAEFAVGLQNLRIGEVILVFIVARSGLA